MSEREEAKKHIRTMILTALAKAIYLDPLLVTLRGCRRRCRSLFQLLLSQLGALLLILCIRLGVMVVDFSFFF
jgi:hypothetical protein